MNGRLGVCTQWVYALDRTRLTGLLDCADTEVAIPSHAARAGRSTGTGLLLGAALWATNSVARYENTPY